MFLASESLLSPRARQTTLSCWSSLVARLGQCTLTALKSAQLSKFLTRFSLLLWPFWVKLSWTSGLRASPDSCPRPDTILKPKASKGGNRPPNPVRHKKTTKIQRTKISISVFWASWVFGDCLKQLFSIRDTHWNLLERF